MADFRKFLNDLRLQNKNFLIIQPPNFDFLSCYPVPLGEWIHQDRENSLPISIFWVYIIIIIVIIFFFLSSCIFQLSFESKVTLRAYRSFLFNSQLSLTVTFRTIGGCLKSLRTWLTADRKQPVIIIKGGAPATSCGSGFKKVASELLLKFLSTP